MVSWVLSLNLLYKSFAWRDLYLAASLWTLVDVDHEVEEEGKVLSNLRMGLMRYVGQNRWEPKNKCVRTAQKEGNGASPGQSVTELPTQLPWCTFFSKNFRRWGWCSRWCGLGKQRCLQAVGRWSVRRYLESLSVCWGAWGYVKCWKANGFPLLINISYAFRCGNGFSLLEQSLNIL